MTMKERLETAIERFRSDSKIRGLDEATARAQVINPILDRLDWDTLDKNKVVEEYQLRDNVPDYALLIDGAPKVFIEVKRPSEDLAGRPEDQLLRYSGIRGVLLAILTNGLNWWMYLPLKEGDAEARRFCELDISNQDVSETCDRLIEFLARENVYSEVAIENAEAQLRRLQEDKAIDNALPRAWDELTAGPDGLLVDLINEKVKGLCGVEAKPERIRGFLVGLGKRVPTAENFPGIRQGPAKKNKGPGAGGGTGILGSLLGPIEAWGCPRAIGLAKATYGQGEVFRNNTERDHTRRRLLGQNYECPVRKIKLGKQLARDGTYGGRFNEYIRNHIGGHAKTTECGDVWDLVRAFGTE